MVSQDEDQLPIGARKVTFWPFPARISPQYITIHRCLAPLSVARCAEQGRVLRPTAFIADEQPPCSYCRFGACTNTGFGAKFRPNILFHAKWGTHGGAVGAVGAATFRQPSAYTVCRLIIAN